MKIVVILSVAQLVFQLEISQMLNGTTPEIQQRKLGPWETCATKKSAAPRSAGPFLEKVRGIAMAYLEDPRCFYS